MKRTDDTVDTITFFNSLLIVSVKSLRRGANVSPMVQRREKFGWCGFRLEKDPTVDWNGTQASSVGGWSELVPVGHKEGRGRSSK